MIAELIDKQDNSEIVRDQIAAILATEVANQQALATADGKDPADYKLRIYTERSNPWEAFLNDQTDRSPIVNVWFDSSNFDKGASNIVERQKTEATFNIDCIGFGMSEDVPGGGHKAGDKEAALEVQRAIRLVRNILMAAEYTYLGMQGVVWQRWPQSITSFQPQIDGRQIQQIVGARLAFNVVFNEFSPQVPAVTLELVSAEVSRSEDGEVIVNADYDYTTP
ncbi:MAG: hypothetical protein CMH18_07880 [Methylophaga sp.]|uniref:hypothetical protein n=1 Tax=Methylophaga sp. TaxID=2024840 RepID=UPI000C8DEC7C|nr:hypothetical protein [Methylophaga sp.]MAL49662.1 hypothetical protein [Methylophaga sp.]|tara:strand:+ start:189 stop:857 length:669 start_codon:yes stop_codon:yes gene_type:complete